MDLKYAGPKPLISHTGIVFDNNKEDKYVYLNVAFELLKSLQHEYADKKIYFEDIHVAPLSQKELFMELRNFCKDFDSLVASQNHTIEDEIVHEIKVARENQFLTEEDKITLENNINIMHDYLIQRSINKKVYYALIGALAELINETKITYIVVPLLQVFLHTLHSLQGGLLKQKQPIKSEIEIFKKDEKLFIKLQIEHS